MAFDDFLRAVQRAAIWLTDGPRRVFGDIGAMSDVLKLQQNISAVAREVFETSFLEPMAASLKNVTNFIGARNVFGRVADLVSLRDVWAAPLFNGPDFLVVANRIAGFAGDLCSSTKWLASVKVFGSSLDSWVNDEITPSISRLKPFKPLDGIGDVSCITGSLFDCVDIVRQATVEFFTGRCYFRNGAFMWRTAGCHAWGLACDVAKVAGAVLKNLSGVGLAWSAGVGVVSAAASLGKFFTQQYAAD